DKNIRPQISNASHSLSNNYAKHFTLYAIKVGAPSFYKDICLSDEGRAIVFYTNAPPNSWRKIPLYKLHHRFTYYG
ncbi:MAG TPA: hypothetical protein VGB84_01690, partial [Arachidicoccus sp.]